ncbi:hypothetical protein FXB40_28120 [Bradyrhizobium rifense]|uniref:Uncharacterized protein n=1 Tax=Bradyrhizobium rifense TaxID=515499 RepID=A0A5D3KCH7_9BRAD|nr:hypothetical protein FXB40_28120 [Bradyrhizobium rifense]
MTAGRGIVHSERSGDLVRATGGDGFRLGSEQTQGPFGRGCGRLRPTDSGAI